MIKHLFPITILFLTLFNPSSLLASSDVGFTIKKEAFSLAVRIGIGELDPEVLEIQDMEEITSADKLFFECLKWVYSNEELLRTMKADVIVWGNLSDKQFSIQMDETETTTSISYIPGRSSQELLRGLEMLLKITSRQKNSQSVVPLYIIKSEEYIDEQWERTDISFGAIPGYTYCYDENVYVVMLWSLDTQTKWVKNLQEKGAKIEQVQVGKNYIKHLLGHLE